jgi:hypothetical protein
MGSSMCREMELQRMMRWVGGRWRVCVEEDNKVTKISKRITARRQFASDAQAKLPRQPGHRMRPIAR